MKREWSNLRSTGTRGGDRCDREVTIDGTRHVTEGESGGSRDITRRDSGRSGDINERRGGSRERGDRMIEKTTCDDVTRSKLVMLRAGRLNSDCDWTRASVLRTHQEQNVDGG